jgi:hypothetical protein
MRTRLALAGAALVLVGFNPGPSHASPGRSAGSLKFHATVTGKAHDSGTISASIKQVRGVMQDFDGCAIVKQSAAKDVFGAETLEIHLNYAGGVNLLNAGVKPFVSQEIYMQLSHYRPSAGTYTDKTHGPLDLAFAMNGHVYGSPSHSTVHVKNGGLTGSITASDALRLYPGPKIHSLHGVNLRVTWSCTTMLHEKA